MSKGPEPNPQFGAGWHPPAQPLPRPSGLQRVITYGRLLTSTSVIGLAVVGVLQMTMPEGKTPADLFGIWHGGIEAAEARTKQEAVVELARQQARAVAREQAKVQWEGTILQKQMESLHESMTSLSDQANWSEWICTLGNAVPAVTTNRDVRKYGEIATGACGFADALREKQQALYAEMSRRYEALVNRDEELSRRLDRANSVIRRYDASQRVR